MRKGDVEIQIMAFLLFVAAMAQWAFMVGAPQQYDAMVERQINDADSLVKSSTVRAHMEEEYVPQSLTDAAYRGMYTQGADGLGPWIREELPEWETWDAIRPTFEDSVTSAIQDEYIGAMRSGAGCELKGQNAVSIRALEEEQVSERETTYLMTFDIVNPRPLHVKCESTAATVDASAGRSSVIKELIAVPDTWQAYRMRYQSMHEFAVKDILKTDEFQNLMNTAAKSSTVASLTGCAQEAGECTVNAPELHDAFGDDHPIEESPEETVAGRLEDELNGQFGDVGSGQEFEVEFTVEDVEYRPYEITEIQHEEWLIQCVQNDDETWYTVPETDGCGGSCEEEDPDPALNSCPDSIEDGAVCTQDCPRIVSALESGDLLSADPGAPSDSGGDIWTDTPWEGGCSTSNVAFNPSTSENEDTGDVAYRSSELRPLREYTRSSEHCSGDACDPSSPWYDEFCPDECKANACEPSCPQESHSCSENKGTESNTRATWRFNLESTTVVEVTITDTRYEIPTEDGFEHPVYTFTYKQENEQAARTVDVPPEM